MAAEAQLTLDQAFELARQKMAAGDLAHAETICRQILNFVPRQPRVLQLLGQIAMAANQLDAAIQNYQFSAEAQPNDPGVLVDLGNALLTAGRAEEAAAAYENSLVLHPDDAGVHGNLGIALFECRRYEAAIEHLRHAVELDGSRLELQNNLGHALKDFGQLSDAIRVLRWLLLLKPDHIEGIRNLAHALFDLGQTNEAIAICRQGLEAEPQSAALHSALLTFLLHDPGITAEALFGEHRRWNQLHAAPLAGQLPAPANDRSPNRRLRVGYVSADLREGPAGFLEYLLACHDTQQFEIFCYTDSTRRNDAATDRLRRSAGQWRSTTGLTDAHLIHLIRQDQIDILVDLSGHNPGSRLLAFARRPAPVQIGYLGYAASTGLDALDYRLVDAVTDPPGATDHLHSEKLIRLPGSLLCYRPPEDAPQIGPSPAGTHGSVTLGSFESLPRINPQVIALWSEVLDRVPASRLMLCNFSLADAGARQLLLSRFAEHGIGSNRLDLRAAADATIERMTLHSAVDIVLDTHPFGGMSRICESLWMGVPAVTLAGASHASRRGASILTRAGLSELIAHTPAEYVNIAEGLAGDLPRITTLRKTLRDRLKQSPLMAGFRFARDIEREYRAAWQRWCVSV